MALAAGSSPRCASDDQKEADQIQLETVIVAETGVKLPIMICFNFMCPLTVDGLAA